MQTPQALTPTQIRLSRRMVLAGGAATLAMTAGPGFALTTSGAKQLVDRVVADINSIISSGKSETRMLQDFEKLFVKYGDVPTIARSVLGPPARSASASDMRAYTKAFQGYMARKYGKRFREFIGGSVTVLRAEPWKSHFQVHTKAQLAGTAPFNVIFRVSDRSGADKFFDMLIEGISLLKTEAVEMSALLEKRRGDLKRLIRDLPKLG